MFTIKHNSTGAILLFNNSVICQLTLVGLYMPVMGSSVKKLVEDYCCLGEERVLIALNADRHYVIHITELGQWGMWEMPTP